MRQFAQKETDLDSMHGNKASRTVVDGSLRATGTSTSTSTSTGVPDTTHSRSIRLYTCCHVNIIYVISPTSDLFFFRFFSLPSSP